ncbi:hypothetical protein [Anaplasma platys]|uniref:hypothetical protein n=1 Tax=Anaplasma platys TaxID=949 RepID=UPI00145EFFB6|nr:hypothetical protein [Anaplasma platys]
MTAGQGGGHASNSGPWVRCGANDEQIAASAAREEDPELQSVSESAKGGVAAAGSPPPSSLIDVESVQAHQSPGRSAGQCR